MPQGKVKQFRDISLVYDADAALTLTVSTDNPLQTPLSVRDTLTFPITTGEEALTLSVNDGGAILEGTLIQFKGSSSGVVRLLSGTVSWRPIGTYIDANNTWESRPMDLGS